MSLDIKWDHFPWVAEDSAAFRRFKFHKNPKTLLALVAALQKNPQKPDVIELLRWGVEQYPRDADLRATLAQQYFERGHYYPCSALLQNRTDANLQIHPLAQELKLLCSILERSESQVFEILETMERLQVYTTKAIEVRNLIFMHGVPTVRLMLLREYEENGVKAKALEPNSVDMPMADSFRWEEIRARDSNSYIGSAFEESRQVLKKGKFSFKWT